MTTVGFNFTKINAQRNAVSEQNIRVENNVGVTNVVEASGFDPKKTMIRYVFSFVCKYEPGLGSVELNGELIELYEKEFGAKIVETWTKEHKVHSDALPQVLNNILGRANIEAIIVSKEIGLPSPIQMPKVEMKPKPASVKPVEAKKEEEKKDNPLIDKKKK